jgi:hypothetical protein
MFGVAAPGRILALHQIAKALQAQEYFQASVFRVNDGPTENYSPGTIHRSYAIDTAVHHNVAYDVLPREFSPTVKSSCCASKKPGNVPSDGITKSASLKDLGRTSGGSAKPNEDLGKVLVAQIAAVDPSV